MVGVRHSFLGFLSSLVSFFLACFVHHIWFAVFLKAGPHVISQLEANSSHCQVSQFPAPLLACAVAMEPRQLVPWLKGANLPLLRLSFCLAVCLCVFVLSTATSTAALLKAGVCVLASWPRSCNQQSISKEKLNFQNEHLWTAVKLPSWPNIPPWKPQKAVGQS